MRKIIRPINIPPYLHDRKKTKMEQNSSAGTTDALNPLLAQWGQENSEAHFEAVVKELFQGTSSLLVPVDKDDRPDAPEGSVRLSSIFEQQGMLIFGAFSTPEAMFAWAGADISYTNMSTQEVLDFCQEQSIGRIVINSNQPDMFVLEREMPKPATVTLEEDMQVRIGPLPKPLPDAFLEKLKASFAGITAIDAAYAYGQIYKEEMSCVLGISLSAASDETTQALHQAFDEAMKDAALELPISLMAIGNDDWLATVQGIPGAAFYQK